MRNSVAFVQTIRGAIHTQTCHGKRRLDVLFKNPLPPSENVAVAIKLNLKIFKPSCMFYIEIKTNKTDTTYIEEKSNEKMEK